MPWSVTARIALLLLVITSVIGAVWYVTDLGERHAQAKKQIEQLQEQHRETNKAIGRAVALERQHTQARGKVAADRKRVQSYRVRLPAADQTNVDPPASANNEAPACGLSEPAARSLGSALGRIWEGSAAIAAEADQCATDLTTLQEWVKSVTPDLRQEP